MPSVGISCKSVAMAARSANVSGTNNEHREIGPAATLGDLLYADKAKPRVSDFEHLAALGVARGAGDRLGAAAELADQGS